MVVEVEVEAEAEAEAVAEAEDPVTLVRQMKSRNIKQNLPIKTCIPFEKLMVM